MLICAARRNPNRRLRKSPNMHQHLSLSAMTALHAVLFNCQFLCVLYEILSSWWYNYSSWCDPRCNHQYFFLYDENSGGDMRKHGGTKIDWPIMLLLFAGLPVAFAYGGFWVGLFALVVGIVALGWRQRKTGSLSINSSGRKRHLRS
ncbi:MAG: hypothetical protein ACI8ZB_003042 [Desulforhopalus sp.]|jgi:hypothetical protein